MAIVYEDRCVECPPELGCRGEFCPNKHCAIYICDSCDSEADLYEFEGEQLCIDCIKDRLEKVE